MKIGCICPNLPGHINPMTGLARHLQERGHEVVFLYSSSASGLPCIPGDKHDDMNANRPEISQLEGNEALALYCSIAAERNRGDFQIVTETIGQDRRGSTPSRLNDSYARSARARKHKNLISIVLSPPAIKDELLIITWKNSF